MFWTKKVSTPKPMARAGCNCAICARLEAYDISSLEDSFTRVLLADTDITPYVSFDGPQQRKREEMLTPAIGNTITEEEALAQKALYEGLELSNREKKMMAILDSVIAGEKVVNLGTVLKRGEAGTANGVPRVALAPVGSDRVQYRQKFRRKLVSGLRVATPHFWTRDWIYDFPQVRRSPYSSWTNFYGEAVLPSVLPTVRDKVQDGDLMLWEPVWVNTRTEVNPPRYPDPAILRPLSDGLYKVVAVWNLTEVEAEVLGEG